MSGPLPTPIRDAAGAWWRAALALAWVAGVALQLRQPSLWADGAYPLQAAAALAVLLVAGRVRARSSARGALTLCALVALGFAFAGWRAQLRVADALAPAWEGCDLEIVGVVDDMPQVSEDGEHFTFRIESAHALGMSARDLRRVAALDAAAGSPISPQVAQAEATAAQREPPAEDDSRPPARGAGAPVVPTRVWLSWDRNQRDDRAVAANPAPLRAGQRWRLPVRLKRPHGAVNPDGFDGELWLFDQDLRATGAVRGAGELLDEQWAPIANARQWVRDRLLLAAGEGTGDAQASGVLAALAVGDQSAISGAGWETFRDTGVAHLMSISGLHITMLGWLGARAVGAAWRRSERAALWLPAPVVARWGGVAVAWLYALLAGWGVPSQRTVLMLVATAALRGGGRDWPATLVALVAMVPVTLLDPWALLQPGFWLSFSAVMLLMLSEPARRGERVGEAAAPPAPVLARGTRALRGGVRAQLVASVGLAPLTLVAFQQLALVGLLANVLAEPWVTLVVTPLALLGVAVPGLWTLAALALRPLLWLLAWLARWPFASVHVATAPGWALVAGLAGGALLMLPVPLRMRLLALPLIGPLAWPFVPRPPLGRFELVAADIGQGTAVLVRTREHLLLFDTGPRFGEDNDAGRRMLLPLMQSRGEPRIDLLVLSHADADHVGGAASILARMPVSALRSSLEPGNPVRTAARAGGVAHTACTAGQRWSWDGVRFVMLHPFAGDLHPGAKTNAVSCVLRVEDAEGRSALLTGDIEAPQEARLVARARGDPAAVLRSDVLVVPHHGSHTSSTAAFLAEVRPRVAVIQVGYRSRYGHPAPDVVARYRERRIAVVRSDQCGAWRWDGERAACARAERPHYWSWAGAQMPLTPTRIGPGPD